MVWGLKRGRQGLLSLLLLLEVVPCVWGQEPLALGYLLYLPPKRHLVYDFSFHSSRQKADIDLFDTTYSGVKTQLQYTQNRFTFGLSERTFFLLELDYFFASEQEKTYASSQSRSGQKIKTQAAGLSDVTIGVLKRFYRTDPNDPLIDIFFLLSPQTGKAHLGSSDFNGNPKRGNTKISLGFRFGLVQDKYEAMGDFYADYYFSGEKKRHSDRTTITIDPYSDLGIRFTGRYRFYNQWDAYLLAGVQLDNSQKIKSTTTIKTSKGLTATYGLGLQYTFLPQKFLLGGEVKHENTEYRLSLLENGRDEMEMETTEFSCKASLLF